MDSRELQTAYADKTDFEEAVRSVGMNATEMVREFHERFGMPVADHPHWIDDDRQDLRLTLIEEEYGEFIEGIAEGDLENVAKELADLIYVICGYAVEAGIDLDAVFEEVHRSNMSKVWEDGSVRYREDGKVLKPPTYSPADVASVW